MKVNLRAQAKTSGFKRKYIEMREIRVTQAQINELARLYMPVVVAWKVGARDRIMPAYRLALEQSDVNDALTRDDVNQLEASVDSTDGFAVRAVLAFKARFKLWETKFQQWHMQSFVSRLLYASNVNLKTQLHGNDVKNTMEQVAARNAALIRDVSDQARGRISDIVFRGLQNRTPAADVGREIADAVDMARGRANRIAADQTQKLSATLDKDRQLQVGMESFRWIHSRKKHPRAEHVERNDKVFRWDSDVGENDPPGQAPFCGCVSLGLLEMDEDDG